MVQDRKIGWIFLKEKLLLSLHNLISIGVIGDKQYSNRYKGFIGELSFVETFQTSMLSGCWIIPHQKGETINSQEKSVIYITSDAVTESETALFSRFWAIEPSNIFIIEIDDDVRNWKSETIPSTDLTILKPIFQMYTLNKETAQMESHGDDVSLISNCFDVRDSLRKVKYLPDTVFEQFNKELAQFSLRNLADVYASRYFFEGVIGFSRGIPVDIDFFWWSGNMWHMLEVKEKDLSKREPRGFGMDIRRISHMRKLSRFLELPYLYVVRQVNNQTKRLHMGWHYIEIEDFHTNTKDLAPIEGGFGMRSVHSSNPTKVCPFKHFKDFEELFSQ